jgi:hypothetical protein
MAPQPLPAVRADASIMIENNTLADRPELAAKIMHVISLWSSIESAFATLLCYLLGADLEIGVGMYQSLISSEAKRAALDGAAKQALSPEDYTLFRAVVKVVKPSRERRNDFAHHLWGHSPQLPDAVLLVDPKFSFDMHTSMKRFEAALEERREKAIRTGDFTPRLEDIPHFHPSRDNVMVYRPKDFDEEIREASKALWYASRLSMIFSRRDDTWGVSDRMRADLRNDTRVKAVLDHWAKQG